MLVPFPGSCVLMHKSMGMGPALHSLYTRPHSQVLYNSSFLTLRVLHMPRLLLHCACSYPLFPPHTLARSPIFPPMSPPCHTATWTRLDTT